MLPLLELDALSSILLLGSGIFCGITLVATIVVFAHWMSLGKKEAKA
ncbi:MAG: hypothetical protein L6Q71_02535 [Planctomycetes bacterium]|nr:hypothetical protein [Planctomycetota bacterium]NUQ34400.1 hypothetical protein [Planctomycetaceae bacterium]